MLSAADTGIIAEMPLRLVTLAAAALLSLSACIQWPPPPVQEPDVVEIIEEEPLDTFLPGLWLIGSVPNKLFEWWRFDPLDADGTGVVRIAEPAGPLLGSFWNCDGEGRWEVRSTATIAVSQTGCFQQSELIVGFGPVPDATLLDGSLEKVEIFVIGGERLDDFGHRYPDDWCDADMNCPDPTL